MSSAMDGVDRAGIIDIVTYFPRTCVSLADLEQHNGVSAGRYTLGLGQSRMAFVTDREDVTSLALTVLDRLVRENRSVLNYGNIGRLEVGTETLLDRSKSVKSSLMQLFTTSGNYEVEGLDNTNGCYGGTQALFNSLNWLECPGWDGRYAVVICTDVAVYKPGTPAAATGGAGAVALLLGKGKDVCIEIERGTRSTYMAHTYDFFKPDGGTEYPTVHGTQTMDCYIRGLDSTYAKWKERASAGRISASNGISRKEEEENVCVSLDSGVDYVVFHTPFNKMIRKALGRMHWHDIKYSKAIPADESLLEYCRKDDDIPVFSDTGREITKTFEKFTKQIYEAKVAPGAWLAVETGNIYTGSLYANLYALMARSTNELGGKRILAYSYGSGMAACTFSMRVVHNFAETNSNTKEEIMRTLDDRTVVEGGEFEKWMKVGEQNWNRFGYQPTASIDAFDEHTFYLKEVTADGRRVYGRKLDDNDNENE